MDSIDVLDPSYGNPTDGTGSLVSNQIKFKKESRERIENVARKFRQLSRQAVAEHVEETFDNLPLGEAEEREEVINDRFEEITDEIVDQVKTTPVEDMNQEFKKTIKKKSEYARRLEARVEALEAKDVDAYVATLKPVPFYKHKPIKIKPVNFATTYTNGKKFSEMEEVPVEESVTSFEGDITTDSFEEQVPVTGEIDVEQVAAESGEALGENIENAMANEQVETSVVDSNEGFTPASSDMQEVGAVPAAEESFQPEEVVETPEVEVSVKNEEMPVAAEKVETVDDIPEKVMSESEIMDEIDKIMDDMQPKDAVAEDTKLINDLEVEVSSDSDPVEEVVEAPVEEQVDESDEREEAIVVPERESEAIVPVDVEEIKEEEKVEEEENLHYDYSDVTEKDIENTNSIAILEEMKKAKEKKLREKQEAEEKALEEERKLVVSREEAKAIRKKAAESEKSVQAKMEEFNRYIQSYDAEIEEANKRREKAASDKEKADQEIAEYEASIASNASIERELDSMMEKEDTKKRR